MQHAPINDPARHRSHQFGVRNAAVEIREVGVDDVPVSAEQLFFHLHRRLLGVAPGPVGVLFRWEIGFSR